MSINNNLIAVSGTKGSGKDELSKMLQYCLSVPKCFRQYWIYKKFGKLIPKKWKIIAFADPLKKMLAVLLNIPIEKFNDRAFKEDTCIDLDTLEYSLSAFTQDKHLLSDSKFTKLAKDLNIEILSYDLTIRQLMQYFGTELMQTYFGKKVWINATLKTIRTKTILSDCRFKAEFEEIKKRGGVVIYINRNTHNYSKHKSEQECKELLSQNAFDIVIDNDGTLKDLFNKIKLCAEKLQN